MTCILPRLVQGVRALAVLLATAPVWLSAAHAQPYPNRPVSFLYGYAAGSSSDAAWRAVVAEAGKRLGQTIVFENRPGASGRLAVDGVMRAKPDGYVIAGMNNSQLVVLPLIDPKLYIEPVKHYQPVIVGLETYLLMVARPNAPFKDVRGMLAYARANPGKINAGSPGAGTGSHLGLAMVSTTAGIEWTHVPYKGAAPALTAMLGGEIDVMFTDLLAKPYIESGKMIGLGVSGDKRWSLFPTLPTIAEAGLGGFNTSSWSGVMGPPGLPADITATLQRAFADALAGADLRGRLEPAGWIIRPGSTSDAINLIRADLEAYRPVIKAANIRLD